MTGAFVRLVCRALIGVVLFAQMAIAAYACPALVKGIDTAKSAPVAVAVANHADDAMVGCDQVDQEAPNLCAAHCASGQQSADHAQAPTVPPMLLSGFYVLPLFSNGLAGQDEAPQLREPVLAAASPPLAILHCCFRI